MQSENILNKNTSAVLIKLLEGRKKMAELQEVVKNYSTLKLTILDLEKGGYVKTEEVIEGRKIIYVELTEKGKLVAEALKEAEWLAKLSPEEIERFANMKAYIHINTYEDHITLQEVHLGKSRIINVFVKPRGDMLYFYCDYHDSDDCEHIELLFADVHLSDLLRSWLKKNGYRLAKKYEKYVEKYW